ncbi:MAG TPA: TRAP transporter substrate-binding protein DctP, partial [Chloroflexota bacterium]|nr:TRAP transporter substrate-binding protein DctP [Chloroflexota bacterium]
YTLPVTGITTSKWGALSMWDLYQGNADIQTEGESVKLLGFTSSGTQWISTAKKPVRTIDDVKGLKLRIAGWGGTEYLKSLNASPIAMAPPDMYESLSKGILDGIVFDWQGINSSRLYEVVSYASTMPVVMQPQAIMMNQAKWKALPPDIQKVFTDMSGKWLAETGGNEAFDAADQEGIDNFKKLNKEIITYSPEEKAKWQEAAKPIWAAWVKNVKDKGLDGQKALDGLQAAIAKNK